MNELPKNIRELFWAEEGLDDAERARVDEYLEAHPEARELRERVRALEIDARESPAIPPFDDPAYALGTEETRQERASYHAWGRRTRGEATQRAPWLGLGWLRWAVPAAAVAAMALFWVGDFGEGGGVHDVVLLRVDREGVTRSVDAGDVWRSGNAFSLEARFARGVVPFVFVVDPSGDPSMLHPKPGAPVAPTDRSEVRRFPAEDSHEIWVLGSETGRETFFLVAGRPSSLSPADLATRARALPDAGRDHELTVAALTEFLETEVGPVAIVEIDHRP